MKRNHYLRVWHNPFFWRTVSRQEIDYVEERQGRLHAYEFKRGSGRPAKVPPAFASAYPDSHFAVVNEDNFEPFVMGSDE